MTSTHRLQKSHRPSVSLAVVALLLLGAIAVRAQAPNDDELRSMAGTLYVIAFPDTTMNTFDSRYPNRAYIDKAILFIYSAVDSKVSIKGKGYNNTINTTGGRFSVVELMGGSGTNAANPMVIQHCKPVDNTFRLESEEPIVVYQYLVTKFGTEAWAPAPVATWGTEYYAAALPGEIGSDVSPGGEFSYNRRNKMFPAEILVIAAYDDTRITIVPTGQVHNDCRAENVTLKAGEAYSLQSYVDTLTENAGIEQPDVGGSRIFSTKPVGVITGNTRAQIVDPIVGLAKNVFKNMQIEWLRPVNQHGTRFVFLPTWDVARPTSAPVDTLNGKRPVELVRIYGTDAEPTRATMIGHDGRAVVVDSSIRQGGHATARIFPDKPAAFTTDRPAQAMMSSAAAVKYGGTTQGFGGYIGAAYDGWGGYMVELVPRDQWASFAPFYTSRHPGGITHYVNVVTDSAHRNDIYLKNGSRFQFNMGAIAGTDLVWGTMSVATDIDNHLEGRNGARFSGFVYGGLIKGGHEEYRPGRARERQEEPPTGASDGSEEDGGEMVLHPSEYEEYLAIAYGYPLPPLRIVIAPPDSLGIRATNDCSGLCLRIEILNGNASGLRWAELENAENAKIVRVDPYPLTDAVLAEVCVSPINPLQDARATVVISDLTGATTRVPFEYFAERLDASVAMLAFGVMTPGTPGTKTVWLKNPLGRALTINKGELIIRTQGFTIKRPTAFPITIAPGDSVAFEIEANPTQPDKAYIDTLRVETPCITMKIPVTAETSDPCVNVGDLDFGTLQPGQSRTLTLRISNDGGGVVSFNNPMGGELITWLETHFTIAPNDFARLRGFTLERGEYIDIPVTFTATVVGTFSDSARIWASVRKCRDMSFWIARVTQPTSAPLELVGGTWLGAVVPNPVGDVAEITFSLDRPTHATIALYDERGARVRTIVDEPHTAGTHVVRVDVATLPAGVYHYRLTAGATSQSRSFVRR